MKVTVLEYPETFSFETKVVFPEFNECCDVRDEELWKAMAARPDIGKDVAHHYTDYHVEVVEMHDGGERWQLGS